MVYKVFESVNKNGNAINWNKKAEDVVGKFGAQGMNENRGN